MNNDLLVTKAVYVTSVDVEWPYNVICVHNKMFNTYSSTHIIELLENDQSLDYFCSETFSSQVPKILIQHILTNCASKLLRYKSTCTKHNVKGYKMH